MPSIVLMLSSVEFSAEESELSEIIGQLKMRSADRKMYATDMADQESALTTLAKAAELPKLPVMHLKSSLAEQSFLQRMLRP